MKRKKIVCFDIRPLQLGHESRGIGMYLRTLLEHLPVLPNVKYVLYAFDATNPIEKLGIKMAAPYRLVQTKTIKKSLDSPRDILQLTKLVFHRFRHLHIINPDTFIQFDFTLGLPPWKNVRKVLLAYDLIPLIYKDDYMPSPLLAWQSASSLQRKLRGAIRALYYRGRFNIHYRNYSKADMVVSISKSTAKSLIDILHLNPSKIITIYPAPVFGTNKATQPSSLLNYYGSYIYYIGATDARKNVQDLVSAFEQVRDHGINIDLILAGKEFANLEKMVNITVRDTIMKSPHRAHIICLGFIPDEEKIWLYKHALAFIFPTTYEGFGLPLVEAMSSKCPIIAYSNSSIPEVIDKSGLLVPTGDVAGLATSIELLYFDEKIRNKLIKRGYARAQEFSWESYIHSFMNVIL